MGLVGGIYAVVEISCLHIRVYLEMLICGGERYLLLPVSEIGTCLGLLSFGRTVKAWEMVCVAGDLCLVHSQLSSCVAGRVVVVVAHSHSALVHGF